MNPPTEKLKLVSNFFFVELAPTLIAANKTVAAPVNMTTVVNISSTTPYTPDDLEQVPGGRGGGVFIH